MGRTPCCSKVGLHRGAWSSDEDKLLINYIETHGEGHWRALPSKAGLLRCGKSCRLRWMNYLRPGIKRGNFTSEENDVIIRLHSLQGNRWSLIAAELPGRTDNEIKNHWNAHLRKVGDADHSKVTKNIKKGKKKRKIVDDNHKKKEEIESQQKSTKVKVGQSVTPDPSSSVSSSSSISLSNNESFDNGMVSGASSSCTIELGRENEFDFDFSWSNWTSLLEMEESYGTIGNTINHGLELEEEGGFMMDGCDLFMSKDDESLMLEKLYHEYLNLLNQEESGEIRGD